MPRCGCASGAQVLMQGESPVVVTGDGSTGSPFVVSLSHDGVQGCEAVTACVAENLAQGLRYDPAARRIGVKLSADAGNAAAFGTDQGLFVPDGAGGGGTTACAQKTVASLEALPAGTLAVGAHRMAGLIHPFSSPHAIDYLVNQNVDVIHCYAGASRDEVSILTDANDSFLPDWRSTIYLSEYLLDMDSSQPLAARNMCGDLVDPHMFRTGSLNTGFEGGWWGWRAPTYQHITLAEMLRKVNGRAVVLIDATFSGNSALESFNVEAAVRAVADNCAQDWALIGLNVMANASTVTGAGMTPCMISNATYNWQSTTMPFFVADMQAAGIDWIVTQRNNADIVHTDYRDAGMNVLIRYGDRHLDRERAEGLQVRGYLSHDPVYTRGPVEVEYRTPQDAASKMLMGNGYLSHTTSEGHEFTSVTTQDARGFSSNPEGGLWLPDGFGNLKGSPSVLQGWSCPLINPLDYTVEWEMMFASLPDFGITGKIGLIFGSPTDEYTYEYPLDSAENPRGYPPGQRQYYRVYQRNNGPIGIGKWEPITGNFVYLNGDLVTEDRQAAEVDTPPPAADVWNSYRLQVTATSISFRRTLSGGASYTITANDADWRGGYFFAEKEEAFLGTDNLDRRPFTCAFRNFLVNSNPA